MIALLTLSQWLSPAFPTGGFAYSHGLETAIARGVVTGARSFADWLAGVVLRGAGWQDSVLLAHALRPGADHAALEDLAVALAPGAERLFETRAQGAALARTVSALTGRALPARPLPVALGQAAAPLGLPAPMVVALSLQAFAGNLCTIATRHLPLGQTQGQAVLADLAPHLAESAEAACRAGIEDLGASALASDLHAMLHETQNVRIFRT